ncbi:MAG: PEGA domain-containing protein [Candidatus Sulfotelmatobacter sp.]
MPTKIGHFEILSELAKSATGTVYKANDPQSGQTVALKAIRLSAFGESAADLEAALLAEAEGTKSVSCPNIVAVFGAGEIEGQFCATMEYVQGNSVSTMLARQEGFSIWDLLDIGRQVCAGLDHAHSHQVFHYSLEPAKIMCGWDGTVKIIGFGISSAGKFAPQMAERPEFLHYLSPEQVTGGDIDGRSNLFSLGAMFYEMVTERKAFDGPDFDSLCQSIVEGTPISPTQLNAKIHPLLGDLIMKALHKDPAQRYQSGRELLDDLEKCKESKAQAVKKAAPAPTPAAAAIPGTVKAAAQSKFVASAALKPPQAATTAVGASHPAAAAGTGAAAGSRLAASASVPKKIQPPASASQVVATVQTKADPVSLTATKPSQQPVVSPLKVSRINTTVEAPETPAAYQSAGVEEQVETFSASTPRIAVDPMMAEGASRGSATSFSEISELPPLKEIYVEPATPPAAFAMEEEPVSVSTIYEKNPKPDEKPKAQPREVAQKAIKEIRNVPPRLMLYSIAGATALILVIGLALIIRIHSLNSDDDSGAARTPAATETPAPAQPPTASQQVRPESPAAPAAEPEPVEVEPARTARAQPVTPRERAAKSKKKTAPPAAPIIIPGQMVLDSTPQGAQVQVDGRTDPSYVTPFLLPGLVPGQHTITVSKSGYTSDTRPVEIASGNKTSLVVHLVQLMATLAVTSSPAGASVFIDGRDTGKTTPAQVNVDKGQHIVLIRKVGFIDETASPQFALGQTVSLSPALRPLGNADSIKTVGKMKKLFGGNGAAAGQLTVSIKTQPKGAQVTINQHMLEKDTPVEVALDPGNYVVDITLSGYAPIHKVVTADKGSKLVVDEIMQKQ